MARRFVAERLEWIQRTPVKGPTRAVLLALSALADSSKACTASFSKIAQTAGLDKRTVMKSLAELEEKGQVAITRRPRGGGHRSNSYRLLME